MWRHGCPKGCFGGSVPSLPGRPPDALLRYLFVTWLFLGFQALQGKGTLEETSKNTSRCRKGSQTRGSKEGGSLTFVVLVTAPKESFGAILKK